MPFPLAHPAAVLPLRRFCPQYLNFPALIIGSLCPDVGYAFGRLKVADFSHQLLAGSFGFCLPVGLLLLLGFYLLRRPMVHLLPPPQRQVFLSLCLRPAGPMVSIVVSLLIGAWTHQLLDAFTHPDDWLVRYLPVLLVPVPVLVHPQFQVCDLLYAGFTFSGVAWVAMSYLSWWERATGATVRRGIQWLCALSLAGLTLLLALVCRSPYHLIGLIAAGICFGVLVLGFLLISGWLFHPPKGQK